ncbi:Suppressor of glycerol defect protein 1 [Pleurostoma richardsiae]|uniref:Suppressor of glycerol defect protein 1 n=1 Tax=Pleurostoma richardsiae TaxID=41990 RepID=A0AA38VJE6_9PEZI|nr:Suppressor of glycerol defect protein 1 [Pleurostoma richardsiae]
MSPARKGPSLPGTLLREIGDTGPQNRQGRHKAQIVLRKEHRNFDRSQKRHRGPTTADGNVRRSSDPAARADLDHTADDGHSPRKKRKVSAEGRTTGHLRLVTGSRRSRRDEESDEDLPRTDSDDDEIRSAAVISKKRHEKLTRDDTEIAELERKLGLKGRKSLPKSFRDEGLLDVLGDLGEGSDDDLERSEKKKNKVEADEWLARKRSRTAQKPIRGPAGKLGAEGIPDELVERDEGTYFSDMSSHTSYEDVLCRSTSDDKDHDRGSADFDSYFGTGTEESKQGQRPRENPYVAPPTAPIHTAYVPPARREEQGSDAEFVARLRRQIQGLVNRLTESNMITILDEIEKLYRDHPRQDVTSVLVDVVLAQICDTSSLPDTLLILTAGFVTAVYKVVGMDFGARAVQRCVERFNDHYGDAKAASSESRDVPKQAANLITFMSEFYNFQLIGCNLIFDYIRFLLEELVELNAELLLRILRVSGPLLRQDDPLALKDIVAMIRPAVNRAGETNISVRTKFMIDTINDLKNNKMKAGASATAVITEHITRMRKALGSLSSRKLKATEPLRMGLKDIEAAEKRGKWWLVGARWAGHANDIQSQSQEQDGDAVRDESDDTDDGLKVGGPTDRHDNHADLAAIAREQMMNTDVRRSIFVAIMSASDYEDAYVRIVKLRLNKDRQREIANVLIQCAGAEQQHNPYYSLIARRLCVDRKVRWAFQDTLWKMFHRLGESIFGGEADEDNGEDALDLRRLVNVGKLYGSLIADGSQSLAILKCLNLVYLRSKAKVLVEVMLITALLEAQQREKHAEGHRGALVERMFRAVADVPELCRGLQYFLKKVVRKSDLVGSSSNGKRVSQACRVAGAVLGAALVAD